MKRFMLKVIFIFMVMVSFSLLVACEDSKDEFPTDTKTDVETEENKSENIETPTVGTENIDGGDTKTEEVETNITLPTPQYLYLSTSGQIDEVNGTLTSKTVRTLAVRNDGTSFEEGTLSCDIKLNGNSGDNGLVFGIINDNNLTNYWEDANIYYYFFFISNAGTAYLGKVSNQSWIICSEVKIDGLNRNNVYTLSVSREFFNDGAAIRCYINEELYISYNDYNNYDGKGFGVRTGAANIEFSNINISKEVLGSADSLEGYYIANGSFVMNNGSLVSITGTAIAEKQGSEFVYGTLSAEVCSNGKTGDSGIIFSLTSNATHSYWESDVSYYFFFINISGGAYLGKVDFGTWTACQYVPINGYNPNNTYTLKVEKDDSAINCYIDGVLYFTHADDFPLDGTGYGVRAGGTNVSFSNIVCQSSGTIVETYPDDLNFVSGYMSGSNGAVKAKANNTVALLKNSTLVEGTFESYVKAVTSRRAGIVFGYNVNGSIESYYRFVVRKEAQKVEVDKVVNGVVTNVYSNYLSAGYSTGKETLFKVVIIEGSAYCYYGNNLYYIVKQENCSGQVGLYAEGSASQFRTYKISTSKELIKVDTLLFGHSYFELWNNYVNDFASVASMYNLGSYINIGIGGSVAAHWELFKESLVTYGADTVVYMIGINDLTGGTSPASVVGSVSNTLAYMKNINPDLKVVLLSVNHCPARNTIRESISQTNILMKNYCAQNDWVYYAEMEYAFCDNGVTPNDYWFTDGLHPSASGYVQKIIPAIKKALDGSGQPELDDSLTQELLKSLKELKVCQLYDYDEYAYQTTEWLIAKPIYDSAMTAILECSSVEEVKALDLAPYINQLEAIKSQTDYLFEEMVFGSNNSVYETPLFSNGLNTSINGAFDLIHDGHRLNNTYQYGDISFNVSITELKGNTPTTSVIIRGKQLPTLGLNGYLINFVTELNYVQVWYMKDAYGTSTNYVLDYLGGWVFPKEVEDTTFKVIVKDKYVYVYTLEDFINNGENAYGCSVDLTKGGAYALYTSGGLGVVNWTTNTTVTLKFTISNIRFIKKED